MRKNRFFMRNFAGMFSAPLCKGSRRAFGATEEVYPQPITAFTQSNLICEHSVNNSKYLLHFYNFGVYIGERFLELHIKSALFVIMHKMFQMFCRLC